MEENENKRGGSCRYNGAFYIMWVERICSGKMYSYEWTALMESVKLPCRVTASRE